MYGGGSVAIKKDNKRYNPDKVTRVQRGLGVAADGAYGPVTRAELLSQFQQPMAEAVKFAENNKNNHGVLSVETTDPEATLNESVVNNLDRFMYNLPSNDNYDNSGTPKFVDFMQQRWAPIGVKNDPNNLNKNWAPNVRHYLQNQYPTQYPMWKQMNLVKTPVDAFNVGVA